MRVGHVRLVPIRILVAQELEIRHVLIAPTQILTVQDGEMVLVLVVSFMRIPGVMRSFLVHVVALLTTLPAVVWGAIATAAPPARKRACRIIRKTEE